MREGDASGARSAPDRSAPAHTGSTPARRHRAAVVEQHRWEAPATTAIRRWASENEGQEPRDVHREDDRPIRRDLRSATGRHAREQLHRGRDGGDTPIAAPADRPSSPRPGVDAAIAIRFTLPDHDGIGKGKKDEQSEEREGEGMTARQAQVASQRRIQPGRGRGRSSEQPAGHAGMPPLNGRSSDRKPADKRRPFRITSGIAYSPASWRGSNGERAGQSSSTVRGRRTSRRTADAQRARSHRGAGPRWPSRASIRHRDRGAGEDSLRPGRVVDGPPLVLVRLDPGIATPTATTEGVDYPRGA